MAEKSCGILDFQSVPQPASAETDLAEGESEGYLRPNLAVGSVELMKPLQGNVYCPRLRARDPARSYQSLTLMGAPICAWGVTLNTYAPPNLQVHY